MTQLVTHEPSGATYQAPERWEVVFGEETTVLALEPEREDGGFRANLVLTVVTNAGLSFRDWQVGTDELLPGQLIDYLLLDLEKLPVADHPGGRRLAHHVAPDGGALVMEQWFTSVDSVGYTLTATVDALRYDLVADELGRCGQSLRVEGQDQS